MQNKGAILVLAILLTLVSLFYLSFTWVTQNIEDTAKEYAYSFEEQAKEYANGNKAKEVKFYERKETEYLDSVSGETVYSFLWIVKDYTYNECKEKELNLGLDLKGGMNVILEVSVVDLIRSLSNNSQDSTFIRALRLAQSRQKDSQEDFVTLFGESFHEIDPNARLAAIFATLDMKDRININSTDEEVLEILRTEVQDAIDNSFNILRSRIDHFGVTQPNIQRLEGNTGRVLVELPGVKDPERVRNLLQGTANLEFWETYSGAELGQNLQQANDLLKDILAAEETEKEDTIKAPADSLQTDSIAEESLLAETDTIDAEEQEELLAETDTTATAEESLLAETDTTEESLLDQTDTTEESLLEDLDTTAAGDLTEREKFAKENPLWAVLTPKLNQQNQWVKDAGIGYTHFKDTAKVNNYLSMPKVRALFPRDARFLWEVKPIEDKENTESIYQLIALKSARDGGPSLSGDVVTNARPEFDQNTGNSVVTMTMNSEGASTWAKLTKQNIGKQIAVVLDNFVYSYPVVRSEITGGRSEISGDFTVSEAKDLANILKSGKMPAPARIIEEEIVGPSLGAEAINAGLISFIIAFVIVLVYMIVYYKGAGVVANLALIANIFFIFGVLASLGAVLTLPGIAGIVLTIGMSVDANVLIYERIREELKEGKGLRLAISDGYKNAYSAIIDANVTTLLTGIILYTFGHGPIKGFATTLIIGILTSLFAAIFITRLIFNWFLDHKKTISFSTALTKNAFKNLNIQFLNKRKVAYVISGLIMIAGIVSLITRGLNQGVDFKGGRTYVVRFNKDVVTTDIAQKLKETYGEAPEVKTIGGNHQVKITTKYLIDSDDKNADSLVERKLYDGLKPIMDDNVSYNQFLSSYRMSSRKVGPTIADDIKTSAVMSIIFSLVIIFLYIFIRFRNWQYGLGALAALMHDVLIVLGLFSILYTIMPFSLEIDQAFIAAILTVVGYSINDTVVVFDRIREYLGMDNRSERGTVYNNALNSTLSRTFSTSLSTFVVLLTIFIFGGEVIRGFIFALLIGVVVGTYSSLFIATPVVYDTISKLEKKDTETSKKKFQRKGERGKTRR